MHKPKISCNKHGEQAWGLMYRRVAQQTLWEFEENKPQRKLESRVGLDPEHGLT